MFKKTIFLKFFSLYLLIILLLSSSILFFSFKSIKKHYIDSLSNNLAYLGDTLMLKILPLYEAGQYKQIDTIIKTLDKDIHTRITVINTEGFVLADSENDPKNMENHKNRPEIDKALKGETGKALRFSSTASEDMLYIALPIRQNGKITGVLRLSLFLKQINTLLNDLLINIFHIALAVLIITLIMAFIFSKSLSGPIKALSAASAKMAEGDFNTRVYLKNKDEFTRLAESFNFMASEVKASFEKISQQKDELTGIISSMQEGLAVLNKEDVIILVNTAFKNIAGSPEPENKFFWEVMRDNRAVEILKKARRENTGNSGEIELNGRHILFGAGGFGINKEVIVLLHDITELKNLETIKKDFVANVSHELKTPLTAIKGFIETIEDEKELNKHYLSIIKRNIDRLINIVQDLAVLSRVEEKTTAPLLQETGLKSTVENAVKLFEKQIKEKGLNLKLQFSDNFPLIMADPFRLEQLFVNLLDNAVKYTEKGNISVCAEVSGNFVKIEVADTGIGIPKEHLSRIFERFYVVDKSRSRKLGGTGLGLSIVKHIVLLHNGSITAENMPEGTPGTKFTILIPC